MYSFPSTPTLEPSEDVGLSVADTLAQLRLGVDHFEPHVKEPDAHEKMNPGLQAATSPDVAPRRDNCLAY
eukprot:3473528-Pyramimonas_sp.AAC.2